MLPLKTEIKPPKEVSLYLLTRVAIFILIFAFVISSFDQQFFNWVFALFIFIGLPLILFININLKNISYLFDEEKLIINTGIFFKHSNSIFLSNIQNIDNSSGPLSTLFNLTRIKIWTAAHSKFGKGHNNPDGVLLLKTEDAKWLNDFVHTKQSPQVANISTS